MFLSNCLRSAMSSSIVLSLFPVYLCCLLGFTVTIRIFPQLIGLWHQFDQDKDGQQTRSSVKFCQVAVAVGSIAPIAMFVFVILWPKDPLTCLQVMVNLSKLSCWKGQSRITQRERISVPWGVFHEMVLKMSKKVHCTGASIGACFCTPKLSHEA